MNEQQAAEKFLNWLNTQVIHAGRGNDINSLPVEPSGKFWLGRLAPEEAVMQLDLGERGERLDPCAIGIRLKPAQRAPWRFFATVQVCAWMREADGSWRKRVKIKERIAVALNGDEDECEFGREQLKQALRATCGQEGLSCAVRVEIASGPLANLEMAVFLVNTSPAREESGYFKDTNLYECELEVEGLSTTPFILEALPDSFRYDRAVRAYGINCGVVFTEDGRIRTTDTVDAEKSRPKYWNVSEPCPDLTFTRLATNPLPTLTELVEAHADWGERVWSARALDERDTHANWTEEMRVQAGIAAEEFNVENERLRNGLKLLKENAKLLRSFQLMNRAIAYSASDKYNSWRPFQVGFLLATLHCIAAPSNDSLVADVVWFATGGGKTETYLGLLVTAAFYDRLSGKAAGITAWSRFPLRMLSLQQTQRFADAFAGAEIVRSEEQIPGDCFSVGFLVGQGATPNSIPEEAKPGDPADSEDDTMPARYQVLLKCPFCHAPTIEMAFDRRFWRLMHKCSNPACRWGLQPIPFYIVDEEIYRFLPTVIVGTLDKAASISMQGGMRCLVGPPSGQCSEPGHGFLYAQRRNRPHGCLVPGCRGKSLPLAQATNLYPPSFRLQDELHLLRDSLGAVDSHYESLLDHLEEEIAGRRPKVLASSATLTGYERQIQLLYQRRGRVFPVPGPSSNEGFWTADSEMLARKYVAVAPRGVTLEYATDRAVTDLQTGVRKLLADPQGTCLAAGVDPKHAEMLISLYGVNVVYGNTLRDIDAVERSFETQVDVAPLNLASLTGRTDFEEVRRTLDALDGPESEFTERLHVITASSMMSHGVDIDRLNIMIMLGIPLTTAEFIQATARVGRKWPGLVYVMHKIGRERDASVFRSFEKYVSQGDRFVEPIPITRRSRRVLGKTVAGIALARILAVHEPRAGEALTTVNKLRIYFQKNGITEEAELAKATKLLALTDSIDEPLRGDLQKWYRRFFENLMDPAGTFTFPGDLSPTGKPMRSLRDVEEQAPVVGIY